MLISKRPVTRRYLAFPALLVVALLSFTGVAGASGEPWQKTGLLYPYTYEAGCHGTSAIDPIDVYWFGGEPTPKGVAKVLSRSKYWPYNDTTNPLAFLFLDEQTVYLTNGSCKHDVEEPASGQPLANHRMHVRLFQVTKPKAGGVARYVVGDAHEDQTVNCGAFGKHRAENYELAALEVAAGWTEGTGSEKGIASEYWGNNYHPTQCDGSKPGTEGYVVKIDGKSAKAANAGGPESLTRPKIVGNPVPGTALTANAGEWEPAVSSFTYEWGVVGTESWTPVQTGPSATWTPSASDLNEYIGVRVRPVTEKPEEAVISEVVQINTATVAVENEAHPIRTPSGELLTFAEDTNHELVSFYQNGAGERRVFNVTAAVGGVFITGSPVPYVSATGELIVFAADSNNELVSFYRTTAGEWKIYNITAVVAGNPTISGPVSVRTGTGGQIEVYVADSNKELVEFYRVAGGEWKIYNITAVVAGNPPILSPAIPDESPASEPALFAADSNHELVLIYRTSGGEWKIYNVTAVVAGNPFIVSAATPLTTTTGELLVFARDTNSELVQFYANSGGEWKVFNITAYVPGSPPLVGSPKPLETKSGELLVFSVDSNNELVSFYRTRTGEWKLFNITAYLGGVHVLGTTTPYEASGGELKVDGRSPTGDLLEFSRTTGGEWKVVDLSAV
jgi:hypothetical protein